MGNIVDKIKTNDSIHGHFLVTDENGKVIISKNNTITYEGKKYLFNLMLQGLNRTETIKLSSGAADASATEFSFAKIAFGDDYQMTTESMKYADISSTIVNKNSTEKLELVINNISEFTFKNTSTDLSLSITKTLNGDSNDTYKFNSIMILLNNGDMDVLFSRVTIDDVYINAGRKYTFVYTIYM